VVALIIQEVFLRMKKNYLLVLLVMKTLTVVGGAWIQMTKRIRRETKEDTFSVT